MGAYALKVRTSYGYSNTDNPASNRVKTGSDSWWWLRSPHSSIDISAGLVNYASTPKEITVPALPKITTQPSDLNLTYGYTDGNTLSVTATGETGHTLTYTGSAQELVTAGEATGGTIYYPPGSYL